MTARSSRGLRQVSAGYVCGQAVSGRRGCAPAQSNIIKPGVANREGSHREPIGVVGQLVTVFSEVSQRVRCSFTLSDTDRDSAIRVRRPMKTEVAQQIQTAV